MIKYYSLDDILKVKAQYNVIFGQRSNGKTYAVLRYGLQQYFKNGKQTALIRRYLDDIMPSRIETIFNQIVKNGEIEKRWKNTDEKWTKIRYLKRKFYLAKTITNKKGDEELVCDERPFLYTFALTEEEDYKENSYPDITTIFFDEFLTRKTYLPDEFIIFCNLLSTIKRNRQDVTIFMVGNTINKYCPYFKEMGLTHANTLPIGKIEVYAYGDSDLKVAVQRADNLKKVNGKKDVDKYFAFDNPKLKMITAGEWELDIYPHAPFKWLPKDIKFTYFIVFDAKTYQCEIIKHKEEYITYIHEKTTPIKKYNDLVYMQGSFTSPYIYPNILKPTKPQLRVITKFFLENKVFYQDNEVGDSIHNYLLTCMTNIL